MANRNSPRLREFSAPLHGQPSHSRLLVMGGVRGLTIKGDRTADLAALRFERDLPKATATDGTVLIDFRHFGPFDVFNWLGQSRADALLNDAAQWTIELRDGVTRLHADLRRLQVHRLALDGGVSRAEVLLPRPRGTVPIRIDGGVSEMTIRRPEGVPIRLSIRGSATRLVLDGERLGAAGEAIVHESAAYASTADRYELTISGSAAGLAATTP